MFAFKQEQSSTRKTRKTALGLERSDATSSAPEESSVDEGKSEPRRELSVFTRINFLLLRFQVKIFFIAGFSIGSGSLSR